MNTAILKSKIHLKNERVLLLPFEDDRYQELKEIIFDDGIWKFMGMFVKTEADFDAYVKNTLADKHKGICYPFLIIDKTSGKVAGSSRYGYLNFPSEKCEIGWTWYGTAFQGTGLNKATKYELCALVLNRLAFAGFNSAQMKRIFVRNALLKNWVRKKKGFFETIISIPKVKVETMSTTAS